MKSIKLSTLSVLILLLAGCYVQQPATVEAPPPPPPAPSYPPPQPPASYQTFYNELAPYGSWVVYQNYGYVWIPNVDPGFRPYCTNGYWAYSDQGWAWVSYYEWGWAPFHYGSWLEDPYYGWMWVPGNDWAPAWVTWGNYNGYYGWAPISPGYESRIAYYNPPISYWCFTDARYMGNPEWGNNYYVARNNRIMMNNNVYVENVTNITIINNTNNYNSRTYYTGPRREEIESRTGTPIHPVTIRESNSPAPSVVNNGSLNIYRPQLNNASRTDVSAKPAVVTPIEKVQTRQSAPSRQQQNTPEINRENKPAQQSAPRQPQFQHPQDNGNKTPVETPQPTVTPQRQAPQSPQATPPAQNRYQTTEPTNQQRPRPTYQANPAMQASPAQTQTRQQRQQAKSAAKQQKTKPAKPVIKQPDTRQEAPKEGPVPERNK